MTETLLDDLIHYDLCWLDNLEEDDLTENNLIGDGSPGCSHFPTLLERKAMILSSFAGMILNNLPVREVLSLYKCKPSTAFQQPDTKSTIVHPFSISYHPFAMLSAYKAVDHSRKHIKMLQLWKARHCKAVSTTDHKAAMKIPASSSPQPSVSISEDSMEEETEFYKVSENSPEHL